MPASDRHRLQCKSGIRSAPNKSAAQKAALRCVENCRRLEPEADATNTGDVVVLDIAVGDATLRYGVHKAEVGIPLRQKPPIEHR